MHPSNSLYYGCCWMYKCTNFLANHNISSLIQSGTCVVVGCTNVLISQLITTELTAQKTIACCCWMYKCTNFLANHNNRTIWSNCSPVVVGCTNVLISQLITTMKYLAVSVTSCCWMYKCTNFLANHNRPLDRAKVPAVVVGCTNVLISQLITTKMCELIT